VYVCLHVSMWWGACAGVCGFPSLGGACDGMVSSSGGCGVPNVFVKSHGGE
jgi:hypothetical protein